MQVKKFLGYTVFGMILIGIVATWMGGRQNGKGFTQIRPVSFEAMRAVSTVHGEIYIPRNPQRIVALNYLGYLLTLDLKPVGAIRQELNYPFLKDKIAGIADVGGYPYSLEKILALAPDLIITMDGHNYQQLSRIAPTIVIPWTSRDTYDQLRELAALLDRTAAAEEWIRGFEIQEKQARAEIAGVLGDDETVGVYEIWAKAFWVVNRYYGRGTRNLYQTLKLKPPASIDQYALGKKSGLNMSLELLPRYAADHIFLSVPAAEGGAKRFQEITNSVIWRNLPAVKAGRVYQLDFDEFFSADPLALERQLWLQVEMLITGNKK